jgi:glucans biosynthesis protein C
MNTIPAQETVASSDPAGLAGSKRIHYLDWLRVLAILMVFLFHAVHPFDMADWQIKNTQQSEVLNIILILLSLWGMPFFFMVAGAASWFALRQRSSRQYISERVNRLLIPFIAGTILFSPLEYYLSWMNRIQRGVFSISFWDFLSGELPRFDPLRLSAPGFSPRWIGIGFHLWFIGFLFCFALITLPLFRWMTGAKGKRFISKFARICAHRGGILLFILPLLIIQFSLRPFGLQEHDWQDFIFQMAFFILGFLVFTDERITRAVRRDGWLLLGVGSAFVLGLLGLYLLNLPVIKWGSDPSLPQFYLILIPTTGIALCYSLTMLFVGMRFLDFTNTWLRYGQEAALPFFIFHQPVIIVIAFYVVQWDTGMWIKLPIVVLSSFVVVLGMYELIVRRIGLLRFLFGMKSRVSKN